MSVYVITCYFNPCGYKTRRANYDIFIANLKRQGVECLTVESAFGDAPFELTPGPGIIQVRADTLVWQKERLLNMAAAWLPKSCKYVAWIDCDVIFENDRWAKDLVKVLKKVPVAQVWETADRLNQQGQSVGDTATSFARVMADRPNSLEADRYDAHGHTGYGWAMRRELFDEVGLYEAAVAGSADHFMAHAIYNHYGFCICNALKQDASQISHLVDWGQRFYAKVKGHLGVVPGNIRHLWHGEAKDRRYFLRMHDITNLGFNPWQDIEARPGHALSWRPHVTEHKTGLKDYFQAHFKSRREDGELA